MPYLDQENLMNMKALKSAIEAIIFTQDSPISLQKIRVAIDENLAMEKYKAAIKELEKDYESSTRGIEIAKMAGGFIFRTKIEHKDRITRMQNLAPTRMSQAMLEVLSIVAFNQPATRERVEEIRGVECGHHLRNLLSKKLIRMVGRSEQVGRPMLYGTTKEFLELFCLSSLKDLPSVREIEDLVPKSEVGAEEENSLRSELWEILDNSEEIQFSDIEKKEEGIFSTLDEMATIEKQKAKELRAKQKEILAQKEEKGVEEIHEPESLQESPKKTPETGSPEI